jgi:hypothetical protein
MIHLEAHHPGRSGLRSRKTIATKAAPTVPGALVEAACGREIIRQVVEKVYFLRLFKNARMQDTRNPEE